MRYRFISSMSRPLQHGHPCSTTIPLKIKHKLLTNKWILLYKSAFQGSHQVHDLLSLYNKMMAIYSSGSILNNSLSDHK